MKYIVKNCPTTYQNFENKFVCTSQIKQNGFPFYCLNCTDCIIKQIVGLCKETLEQENDQINALRCLLHKRF